MKLEFKPEDFATFEMLAKLSGVPEALAENILFQAAKAANARLREWLEAAPVVTLLHGRPLCPHVVLSPENAPYYSRARLVEIEALRAEEKTK